MKRKFIFLLLTLFVLSSLPLTLLADNNTPNNSYEITQHKPRKKYKKRTDSAPKNVHVKGYKK